MIEKDIEIKEYQEELSNHPLFRLFFPRNIVIVGASQNTNMGVSFYLNTYKKYGFGIKKRPYVYPVNPKYDGKKIFGLWKCYSDLKSIPESIDIVLCCINARYVSELLKECIKVKAKFLVIYSSGFSEVGKRGISYSNEIKKILKGNKTTRVIGPNCFGSFNSQINLNISQFADLYPGNFSLFSQSGGFANRTVEYSKKRGVGINLGISVGNMIDLEMNDFIEFFSIDKKTHVIGCYLETVRDMKTGQKFLGNLRRITKEKPVIILKGGKNSMGARSALSHTGSIAGSNKIFDTVFKQSGVINVNSSIEFYDISYLLSTLCPDKLLKSKNTCLIVPGGGNAVEMADILGNILKFPEVSKHTQDKLTNLLYDVNTCFNNPIDVGAYGILPEMILNTIKLILKEDIFDNIIIVLEVSRIIGLQFGYNKFTGMFARSLGRLSRKTEKNFFLLPMVDEDNEITIRELNTLKENLNKYRIPHFPSIDRLAKSLEYLIKYCNI